MFFLIRTFTSLAKLSLRVYVIHSLVSFSRACALFSASFANSLVWLVAKSCYTRGCCHWDVNKSLFVLYYLVFFFNWVCARVNVEIVQIILSPRITWFLRYWVKTMKNTEKNGRWKRTQSDRFVAVWFSSKQNATTQSKQSSTLEKRLFYRVNGSNWWWILIWLLNRKRKFPWSYARRVVIRALSKSAPQTAIRTREIFHWHDFDL